MSKTLNIDFYKISILASSSISFEDILQKTVTIQADKRAQEIRNDFIFLYQANFGWQKTWEGETVRVRMNDVPVKGSKGGTVQDIILADDEGIGEQTAFIYHPGTKILALQSNRHGVSPITFAKYFESISGESISICLDPVIQIDAIKKLERVKTVKRFHVRVAGLNNMTPFNSDQYSVNEIVALTKAFEAPSVTLELGGIKGRNKDISLALEKVRETALSLVRISNQNKVEVKSIRISGSSDEDEKIYIDLLKDRMRETIDIKNSGTKSSRNIPYTERRDALREAWNHRESEIVALYGPQ